jgi:hypothetical protein
MAKKSFSNDLLRDLHSETLSIDLIPNFNEPIELSALNSAEQEQLNLCETIIEKGYNTFIEVGNALFEIRNNKLYREKHSTFEEYCKQKWQIKRQRAYELMDAASIVNTLSEISDKNINEIKVIPKINIRESHAVALGKIPEEMRNVVWQKVVDDQKESGKTITAKTIQFIYSQEKNGSIETSDNNKLKENNDHKIYAKIVRGKIKNANDSDITIAISGKFIVENNLVPIWRKLRGFSEDIIIDNSFEDIVSIHQASVLGLFPNS